MHAKIKVGDLVKVMPSGAGTYMVTDLEAYDAHYMEFDGMPAKIPNAVMLVCLDDLSPPSAMNKKWIEVISSAGG
jgi:hypothetical protein